MDLTWLVPTLKAFWDSIYPEFVLAVVGAVVVVWQIRKQFTYALAQSRHNELLKLKLKLYQEIVPIAHAAQDAVLDLQSFVRKFESDVSLFKQMARIGRPWSILDSRVPVLIEKNGQTGQRAIDIIFFAERWQIVDPRIDLFKTAVNVALHDMRSVFQQYFSSTLTLMPIEAPPGSSPMQGSLLPWQPPDDAKAEELKKLSESFDKALSHLGNWLHDLQVELQNLFVGELFEHKVPCRQPLDPDFVVVRLDRYEELTRYFEEETDWGRYKAKLEREVRERIGERTRGTGATRNSASESTKPQRKAKPKR